MAGITELLSAVKEGVTGAEAQLFSLLYVDLRQLAHSRLRRSHPSTLLDTTALVHEAYLRLHCAGYVQIADCSHFLAYAARAMRSIVVDFARRHQFFSLRSVSRLDHSGETGETIVLYGNRFCQTSVPVLSGSLAQSGTLPALPVIKIGGVTATVQFAGLVAPGEFQFNVVVPPGTTDGDQPSPPHNAGVTTPAGTATTIEH
ncbi:MAG TPA: ECF-type sigma factor [Bryobacteraceae bacterium]|nr:ECF-type sigma factor [Bryobacteraceae bacterium]